MDPARANAEQFGSQSRKTRMPVCVYYSPVRKGLSKQLTNTQRNSQGRQPSPPL